jgi:hypothetical protein
MFCAHPHVLRVYEIVSRKTDFLCCLCKNEKIRYQNKSFHNVFLVFFVCAPRKTSVLNETLREHVEYGDLHVNIFS